MMGENIKAMTAMGACGCVDEHSRACAAYRGLTQADGFWSRFNRLTKAEEYELVATLMKRIEGLEETCTHCGADPRAQWCADLESTLDG